VLDGLNQMAKTTNIPDSDNVLRYAKNKHLKRDNNKQIYGCFHDLFKLRDDDDFIKIHGKSEKNLSVNWLEFFNGNNEQRLQKAIQDICSKRTVKKNDRFTKLNVGEFKNTCEEYSAKVRIIHDAKLTKSKVKSHSSITQLPQDNLLLLDDLCTLAFKSLIKP
jgi:hypothetical protein